MDFTNDQPLSIEYDNNRVRYRLVKSNPSHQNTYNWLFLPGGPGADSIYYMNLINQLEVPGDFWLIDFPENGDNTQLIANYDFDQWQNYFIPAIKRFENPILVGQSFGAMFPLLFPELENILRGFVIFNSTPRLCFAEAADYAKKNNISTTSEAGEKFRNNPCQETFQAALLANAHCHFPAKTLAAGREMFARLPFNYQAPMWWIKKIHVINYNAKWIPQNVPTLILGGEQDYILPCSIFENDQRFQRNNIKIKTFPNAGHFLWFEEMEAVKQLFNTFIRGVV